MSRVARGRSVDAGRGRVPTRAAFPAFAELRAEFFAAAGARPRTAGHGLGIHPLAGERDGFVVVAFLFHPEFGLEHGHGQGLSHLFVEFHTADAGVLQNVPEQTDLGGVRGSEDAFHIVVSWCEAIYHRWPGSARAGVGPFGNDVHAPLGVIASAACGRLLILLFFLEPVSK